MHTSATEPPTEQHDGERSATTQDSPRRTRGPKQIRAWNVKDGSFFTEASSVSEMINSLGSNYIMIMRRATPTS